MKKLYLLLLICLFVVSGVLPLYGAMPTTITLTVGNTSALVNGNAFTLDVAPFIKDGRTFVPLRFVSEQLGAEVTYTTKEDGTVDQVKINVGGLWPGLSTEAPSPTPTPTPTPTPAPSGWREIARWTGNGAKSTEKFTVPNEWRLTWSCDGTGYSAWYFGVYVYKGNGDLFKLAANTAAPGSDTSVFHEGGEFYLEINTVGVSYTILIEGLY